MRTPDLRLPALRRFAIAITIVNLLGHLILGFENSWAQLLAALFTAYALEIFLELIDGWAQGRAPRFRGGMMPLIHFLMPAHITGMAISMLLYATDRLMPFVFASAVAIASKAIFTAPVGKSRRHFLNPSNTGICVALLLFPSVAPIMPWQFTENLTGSMDWVLPALIVYTGTVLNARFTGRLPLIVGWLAAFALQGYLRHLLFETPLAAALAPMTGVSFILFTFYMVTDPGSTPSDFRGQIIFGAAVATLYGLLVAIHVVFGLFFALLMVCALRGACLYLTAALSALIHTETRGVEQAHG